MYVIITCKYEKDLIKNSLEKVETSFSHYKPMGIFFRHSRAANSAVSGPIRPKFKLVQALMHVIVTCKYEKERMKKGREKVATTFSHYKPMGIFSDVQGQLTPQSVVQSGRNSNLSKLSCMSSLPASMKRNG